MNLASNTAPLLSTPPVQGAGHPPQRGALGVTLHVRDHLARWGCVTPTQIKPLSDHAKLNNEVPRDVPRLGLAAFLPP
jgi:hypothetical protein